MHCQQGGEVWTWNGLLDAFRRFSCGFEPFWALVCTGLTGQSAGPIHMLHTGLTCHGWVVAVVLFKVVFYMHSSRGSCIGSGGACMCQGSSLWFFELWFGGLRSLLEHSFVSDVSSRCPCLRGPRLVFFKWSCSLPLFGFRSLVGVSFYSFRFFFFSLVFLYVGIVNAHQGGDWRPCMVRGLVDGRFLVWWVIDKVVWTDSWLSIACACCGLTGVGAGEEQARKVIAGEASRCGEDK
jgi:hypothetical protein